MRQLLLTLLLVANVAHASWDGVTPWQRSPTAFGYEEWFYRTWPRPDQIPEVTQEPLVIKYLPVILLLTVVNAHAFFVHLEWDADPVNREFAYGYRVWWDAQSHATADAPSGINIPYPNSQTFGNSQVSEAIIDDIPAGFWCFRVTAWNDVVETGFSNEVCAHVTEDVHLRIPSGLGVKETGR